MKLKKIFLIIIFLAFIFTNCAKNKKLNGIKHHNVQNSKKSVEITKKTTSVPVIQSLLFKVSYDKIYDLIKKQSTEKEKIKKIYEYIDRILLHKQSLALGHNESVQKYLKDYFAPRNYCKNISKQDIVSFYGQIKSRYVHPDFFEVTVLIVNCCNDNNVKQCKKCMNSLIKIKSRTNKLLEKRTKDIFTVASQLKSEFSEYFGIEVVTKKYRFFNNIEEKIKKRYIPPLLIPYLNIIQTLAQGQFSNIETTVNGFLLFYIDRAIKKATLTLKDKEIYEDVKKIYCYTLIDKGKLHYFEDLRHDYNVTVDWRKLHLDPSKYAPIELVW